MKTRLLAWASWITFLVSAISEWGLDIDLPLSPALWLVMAALMFFATNASAALTTNSWADGSGKWELGLNWDHGVPTNSDSANVIVNAGPAFSTLTPRIDGVTVASNALNGCMTISNLTLSVVNSFASETLLITNATLLTTPLKITKDLTISNHTSVVISNAALQIGGTSFIVSHVSDNGNLTLFGGTIIASNANFSIGDSGIGAMTVLGGTWLANAVEVGDGVGSQGTLRVADGTNTVGGIDVGYGSGATGAFWLTGGQLTVKSIVTVGDGGVGQMTVSNGTWLTPQLYVGVFSGSQGTLTMAGGTNVLGELAVSMEDTNSTGVVWLTGGHLVNTGACYVGAVSVGRMTVSNGTWLAKYVVVGLEPGSQGTLTVAGGTSTVFSNLTVGADPCASTGIVNVVGGELEVTNAAHNAVLEVRSGTLTLNSGILAIDNLVITNSCGRFLKTGGMLSITTTNISANLDADGDGLPNSWETSFGLNPFSDTGNDGPNGDPDGDGFTNLQEFLAGSNPLSATSIPDAIWINSSSGKWEVGGNWFLTVPPTNNQSVFITNTTSKVVTIDAATTNAPTTLVISNLTLAAPLGSTNTLQLTNAGTNTPLRIFNSCLISNQTSLVITNGAVEIASATPVSGTHNTLILDGTGTLVGSVNLRAGILNTSNAVTRIGDTGRGQLTMDAGSWFARNLIIGYHAGGNGTLTVNGGRMELHGNGNGGATFILGGPSDGGVSTGTVWVTGGELVLTNNFTTFVGGNLGSGKMTVSNGMVRASDLFIGASAVGQAGTFTQAGGTTEVTAVRLSIGYNPGSTGYVWVTGGTLLATNEFVDTLVGGGGKGWLIISNGDVQISHLVVATNAAGSGTLSVFGGTLTVLSSNSLKLATASSAIANVSIRSATLNAANASVVVGDKGTATLTLSNSIASARIVSVGASASATGTVSIGNGSIFSVVSNLTVGIGNNSLGTLIVTNGGILIVTNNGSIFGFGPADAEVTVDNGTVVADTLRISALNPPGKRALTVANGGNVSVVGNLKLDEDPNGGGEIFISNGGNVSVLGDLDLGEDPNGGGEIIVSSATLSAGRVLLGKGTGSLASMVISSAAATVVSELLEIGSCSGAGTGLVTLAGGSLFVTNAAHTAVLDLSSGRLTLSNGTLKVDTFVMTNACGHFVKTGGTLIYGSAVLDPARDDDGDGLPNGWEQTYGLDPLDPSGSNGAAGDPDGDGQSNLAEYLAGTVPTVDIKSIKREGNDIRVTWQAAASKTNALQRTTGVANGSYSNNFADSFVVTNNVGGVTNYLDVSAATNFPSLFYRVRLVP